MALFLLLAGCADPMSTEDGIWPAAGSAQRENLRAQTVPSTPSRGPYANPGGSGARAAAVIEQYQSSPAQAQDVAAGEDPAISQ